MANLAGKGNGVPDEQTVKMNVKICFNFCRTRLDEVHHIKS